MYKQLLKRFLSKKSRRKLKRLVNKYKVLVIRRFYSYDDDLLKERLVRLGLTKGDTVMVHSSFSRFNGFEGGPQDVVSSLIDVVGEEGNLLMVSLPYRTSSAEYLESNPVFDVSRTPSQMGLISEAFRKRPDVMRSVHPTHPMLAWGQDSVWLTADHHKCPYGCGTGSPFDKFFHKGGKVLFFDVAFGAFTFFHYIEDLIKDRLPFDLYSPEPMNAEVVDTTGTHFEIPVYVFSPSAVRLRAPLRLEKALLENEDISITRIGNTTLRLVESRAAVECANRMYDEGQTLYRSEAGA
jgi:aminoglycoside N3'-acetyltransferase